MCVRLHPQYGDPCVCVFALTLTMEIRVCVCVRPHPQYGDLPSVYVCTLSPSVDSKMMKNFFHVGRREMGLRDMGDGDAGYAASP